MNKNVLLGFNFLLLVLVGVLFYFHFSDNKKVGTSASPVLSAASAPLGGVRIAYFVMDSIEKNYEYLKDVKNELKGRENELTGQLTSMKNRYMEKVAKFQQEGQTMSQERQSQIQQELMNEQKVIQNKEQSITGELQNQSFEKLQRVNKTIEDFLKDFNRDRTYAYILGYQEGTIYYKDTAYDITGAVLQGLNDLYKKKSKE